MCAERVLVDRSEYDALINMYHSCKAVALFFRESSFVVMGPDANDPDSILEGRFSFPLPDSQDVLVDSIVEMYQSVDRAAEFVLQ